MIAPDFAWCQPQAFWALPQNAQDELKTSDLVIIKGDCNYRRLLNDCLFDLSTPFEDVSAYFPAPILALRTLKAELGCGIPPERRAMAERDHRGDWMVSGRYGVVQFNENLDRQHYACVSDIRVRHVRRTRLDRTRAFVAEQGSRRSGEREQRARR